MSNLITIPVTEKDWIFKAGKWNSKYTYNNSTGVTFDVNKINLAGNAQFYIQNLPLGKKIGYKFINTNLVSSSVYSAYIGSWTTSWLSNIGILLNKSSREYSIAQPIDNQQFLFNSGTGVNIEILEIWVE